MSYAPLALMLVSASCVLGQGAETVKQEDLIAHYERYNGSRLIVSGQVVSRPEMSVMYLRSTSTVSDAPAALGAKPDPLAKRYIRALKRTGQVDVELSGQFEGAADRFGVDRVISVK